MENKLLEKTDVEINNTHKNLKIILILYTIVMLFLIGIVVYTIISKGKSTTAIMIGGTVIPYIILGSNYQRYEKEKKRRNI